MQNQKIHFNLITGNHIKVEQFNWAFNKIDQQHFDVQILKIDLPEYQGEPTFIALEKAKKAFEIIKKPILVEDCCLYFDALNGLPGPYIKWFHNALGDDGLVKLLSSFSNKKGYVLSTAVFIENFDTTPIIVQAIVPCTIIEPRGPVDSIAWESIVLPDGKDKTYAELGADEKYDIYHRTVCYKKMFNALLEHYKLSQA